MQEFDEPLPPIWRIREVQAKIAGAVVVPVAVAIIAAVFSNAATSRQVSAQMVGIAVSILQAEIKEDGSDQAMRRWAVSVLESPTAPPPLTPDVGEALLETPLQSLTQLKNLFDDFRLLDSNQSFDPLNPDPNIVITPVRPDVGAIIIDRDALEKFLERTNNIAPSEGSQNQFGGQE